MKDTIFKADRIIIAIIAFLMIFGLIQIYSSSYAVSAEKFSDFGGAKYFVKNQAIKMVLGLIAGFLVMHIDYKKLITFSTFFYGFAIVLLIMVLGPNVEARNGAKRWLSIAGFSLQVSEVARIGLVLILSRFMAKWGKEEIRKPKPFLILLGLIATISALVAIEPDFSSSFFITSMALALLFVGGVKTKHLMYVGLGALFVGTIFMTSADYRMARLTAFFNKTSDVQGDNFQSNQALIAIGNGGLTGEGLGNGIQKEHFLPEPHTDFIFASFSEEFGFIGVIAMCALFFTIFWRGFRIAKMAPDDAGRYLATGLTLLLVTNFVAHTAVNVGFFPTTGITLPFISFGGMSLIITMIAMAILLNISSQCEEAPGVKK